MNSMSTLPKNAREAQRKHPLAYACLLFAMLLPIVVGITEFGLFLKSLFPSPNTLHLAAGACAFILLVPILMCVGAWCWLLMARRAVPRSVVRAFAVHPGFGILSRVSKWMFVSVYGDDDNRHAQPSDEPNGAPPHRLS
jgi:hypothetical protein